MKTANIAELKSCMSAYMAAVEHGEEVLVCKRNVPFARIVPCKSEEAEPNRTQLGCGRGTVTVNCDLTEPAIPLNQWNMLSE